MAGVRPTLLEKIWDAVYREPRLRQVALDPSQVKVFPIVEGADEKAAKAKEALVSDVQAVEDVRPKPLEGERIQQTQSSGAHDALRHGGALNVARSAGSMEGEHINYLQTKVTTLQGIVAKDGQQLRDISHHVRLANDQIRVQSGAK